MSKLVLRPVSVYELWETDGHTRSLIGVELDTEVANKLVKQGCNYVSSEFVPETEGKYFVEEETGIIYKIAAKYDIRRTAITRQAKEVLAGLTPGQRELLEHYFDMKREVSGK